MQAGGGREADAKVARRPPRDTASLSPPRRDARNGTSAMHREWSNVRSHGLLEPGYETIRAIPCPGFLRGHGRPVTAWTAGVISAAGVGPLLQQQPSFRSHGTATMIEAVMERLHDRTTTLQRA